MKKLMKLLCLVMAAVMVLVAAAACDTATDQAEEEESAEVSEETAEVSEDTTEEGIVIGFSMPEVTSEGFAAMATSVRSEAEAAGVEIVEFAADNDAAAQMTHFEDFITRGVDAIIFCPVDAAALSQAVQLANDAGIPVVAMDRSVEEGDLAALIQSDNVAHGYEAGVFMAEAAEAAGMEVSDLQVLELQGDLASSAGLERSEGFQQACEELGITIVTSLPTYWDTDTSYNAVLDAFQAHPEINAIFEASDSVMCTAVNSALEQLELLIMCGEAGHIIVTAVDGSPIVIQAIKDGSVDACAVQGLVQFGVDSVDAAMRAINGELAIDANETKELPPAKATIDNIDSDQLWANTVE